MLLALLLAATPVLDWKPLAKGVEYRTFALEAHPSAGDGLLHVVRIEPSVATLELGLASLETKGVPRTAGEWADAKGFVVTINAGMFDLADRAMNVGHLHHGEHVNQPAWKPAYQSVLVFGPRKPGLPAAQVLDRDDARFTQTLATYATAVQNLRLIKSPGVSVWKPNARRWSEALVAQDAEGRLLFVFSRTPYEMADLNQRLLALPLHVVRAFHVEGGPEASLSIRAPGLTVDLCGSYETGFVEDDGNARQWALPNVLGVR
jgi:hypothetical protein